LDFSVAISDKGRRFSGCKFSVKHIMPVKGFVIGVFGGMFFVTIGVWHQ